MSLVVDYYRQRLMPLVRAYRLACAHDDAIIRGLTVPTGIWTCRRCQRVLLELTAFREHLRVEHSIS